MLSYVFCKQCAIKNLKEPVGTLLHQNQVVTFSGHFNFIQGKQFSLFKLTLGSFEDILLRLNAFLCICLKLPLHVMIASATQHHPQQSVTAIFLLLGLGTLCWHCGLPEVITDEILCSQKCHLT